MVQQSNTAALADDPGRQHVETARHDPTEPLRLGTTTETNDPVTLSRADRFDPLLICGNTGTGKTVLAHQLAYQQLAPERGLCYMSAIDPALVPIAPPERTWTSIDHEASRDPCNAVPDDIGTDATIHSVGSSGETERNTGAPTTTT